MSVQDWGDAQWVLAVQTWGPTFKSPQTINIQGCMVACV